MSVTWVETHESRRRHEAFVGDSSAELQYVGFGSTADDEVESALLAEIPSSFRGLPLRTWDFGPLGGDVWEATVHYSTKEAPEPPDTGEVRFSCDLTGGTTKITQSLETTAYAPAGETAPDFKGAIGVIKKGGDYTVNGLEVPIPSMKFQLTYRMPQATLTLEYVRTLKGLKGKYNNAVWKGFAAGEVLFLGAQCEEGTQTDPTVVFHFSVEDNATNIDIGGVITVSTKLGHQFLETIYEDTEDASAKRLVPNPIAAYVHDVFHSADFSLLGIGT